MLPPLIQRPRRRAVDRPRERGVTLALVALAIFSIIAMAGLSIDVGTLYQASAEAQRAADQAALAAARVLSLSGITGDPKNSGDYWSSACAVATQIAQTVANQNNVGGAAPSSVTVTFLSSDKKSDCTAKGSSAFGVNPMVTVKVTQSSLPTYFSRIWGRTGSSVSATATAEAFNPSDSGKFTSGDNLIPVQPRCVKPWIVPNLDPDYSTGCGGSQCPFVNLADGSIHHDGISIGGSGAGVIGETFTLAADCNPGSATCNGGPLFTNPPGATPNLQYVPGQVLGTPVGVPSCVAAGAYQQAIAGCDQSTAYQCGVAAASASSPNLVNLNENPGGAAGDTSTAAQCLINQANGQDAINVGVYPYQISAGSGDPLNVSGSVITSSNSVVTLPIYDNPTTLAPNGSNQAPVTIVGFLQVFIQFVDTTTGNLNVRVLNVAGCGNTVPSGTQPLYGTSPVPVRLITPP
jgi:Flp pilus assembly protein TadG